MTLRVPDIANAAHDALAADATLTTLLGGAKVYNHVPEDTTSPYVMVLGAAELPWEQETNNAATRQVDLDADVWSHYRGTKEIDDIGSQVLTTLLAESSWSGVSGFAGVLFIESPRPITEFIEGNVWYRRRVTVRVYLG